MARLEKTEELKFVRYVNSRKWKAIKLAMAGSYGVRGYNDRLVLAPIRIAVLFEFKRVGEAPTKIQLIRHRDILNMGFPVYVVYTAEEAIKILNELVHPKAISKGVHTLRDIKTSSRVSSSSRSG